MLETLKQFLADPPFQAAVFWFCALVSIVSALVAAFSSRIVRAAYSLFFTLFGLAGFYVLLGADFLAIVQVVVYIGGILALILFGVLLTNRMPIDLRADARAVYLGATAVAVVLCIILVATVLKANWRMIAPLPEIKATTASLGRLLLSKYLLPFEFISVTLLIALLGASYLVRREDD